MAGVLMSHPRTCNRNMKRTWVCLFERGHEGPCGLVPRWWNWTKFARRYRWR